MRVLLGVIVVASLLLAGIGPARADQNDPSLPEWFKRLETATNPGEGLFAERKIWSIWVRHDDPNVAALMRIGSRFMGTGHLDSAHEAFAKIIEKAPDFAEGWNKRATVRYMLGDLEGSVRDIERTLALEPKHFGALSGLGLIYMAIEKPESALKAFEKAREIHPTSLGAKTHIDQIREMLKGKKL